MEFDQLLARPDEGCRFLLDRVGETRRAFPIRAAHLIADLSLLGYGRDLLEHGAGLLSLGPSADPLPALTLARAAREASDEMVLLATAESYDEEGARVFALSAFEAVSLEQRLTASGAAATGSDVPTSESQTPRWKSYLLEVQAAAERIAAGSGAALGEAVRELEAKPKKQFGRWERGGVAELLSQAHARLLREAKGLSSAPAPSAEFFSAQFGTLSMWAHPRPRVNPKTITLAANGRVQVEVFLADSKALGEAARLTLLNALMMGEVALRYVHGLKEGT